MELETVGSLAGPAVRPAASWRVSQDVVDGARASLSDTLWFRAFAWFFFACGYVYYFLIARSYLGPEANLMAHLKAIGMISVSQLVLCHLYRRLLNRVEIGPGLRRLSTKVPSDKACPVAVEIRQDGAITGYDEGYMWLEDGTLFFKGLQTVFRLNREDVPPIGLWPKALRPVSVNKMKDVIPVPMVDRDVKVWLKLIDPFEDYTARRRATAFRASLLEWFEERPKGWLESMLPPLELHPSLAAAENRRREGQVGAFLLAGLDLGLVFGTPWPANMDGLVPIGEVLTIATGLLLFGIALRLAWDEWSTAATRRSLETAKAFTVQ
ncbi:MAG: hypothetical protein KIT11_11585 [Fimbriimonadaceae bacterium]|nr:hypothetical protein [Fimbriimonadaceae bacterium]QYK55325.1 MAG: hypothetical protein KF733_09950 [Fimbriimonadaceae bacterium]